MQELKRYEQERQAASTIAAASATYRERVREFLAFVNAMRGNSHDATFQEKRHVLDVPGAKVAICKVESGNRTVEVISSP